MCGSFMASDEEAKLSAHSFIHDLVFFLLKGNRWCRREEKVGGEQGCYIV